MAKRRHRVAMAEFRSACGLDSGKGIDRGVGMAMSPDRPNDQLAGTRTAVIWNLNEGKP